MEGRGSIFLKFQRKTIISCSQETQYEEINKKTLPFIPIKITGFPLEKLVCPVEQSQQGGTIGNMQSKKQN